MAVIAERRGRGIPPETGAARALGPVGARTGEALTASPAQRVSATAAAAPRGGRTRRNLRAGPRLHAEPRPRHPPARPSSPCSATSRRWPPACQAPLLTAHPSPDMVEGGLQVRIGRSVRPSGAAPASPATKPSSSGSVYGAGSDAGRSLGHGGPHPLPGERRAGGGHGRLDLDVGYTLTGPLRSSPPRPRARPRGPHRADFSRNDLDARLSGCSARRPPGFDPLRLLLGVSSVRASRRGSAVPDPLPHRDDAL